jgi:heat shock protein HtpX
VSDTQVNVAARFARAAAESKRRTLLLLALFVVVLLVLGAVIGLVFGSLPAGLVGGLVFGVVLALSSYYRSDRIALARSAALVADAADYPRYHNLVEGLCVAAGLPKPDLYVIDDSALNGLAIGRDPKHASLAVTTGLLDGLNRIELEGVLACELSHVKQYDTLPWTAAVLPSMLLGPLGRYLMSASASPERDLLADASGVQLTRFPPGLCSALKKLRGDGAVIQRASRATASMWIASPLARETGPTGSSRNAAADPHPPLEERIRILEEL